ncbi:Retrovirus-related Pol polyprotein from transposon TNT 1-94 [Sesamum alatum]|uniref:Retrovirus-related Pol polyprotein from transposon TNT 1-94 n=1 Tax=Sesamum alatum TaxID=300844 RepID=A0AAE1XNP8_9LAMI|nr:Retrovirus-related Pol polyprotein from transposon TNT 1-94 [Sesamum alatum]
MPKAKDAKEWELLNRKAVAMIRKYIDRSLFEHKIGKIGYNDGQSMIEHLNNFKGLVNQLTKIEMKIDDELQALLLLSSLPESWDTLVVTLSNSALEGKLSMDGITDSLLNEESRRK